MRLILILVALLSAPALAGRLNLIDPVGRNYQPNAYGPGVHMDQYGRPFTWTDRRGRRGSPMLQDQVNYGIFGPNTGSLHGRLLGPCRHVLGCDE